MKRNTFYIITSLIVLVVAVIIYFAISCGMPAAMHAVTASVIIAAITVYILRAKIDDALITDELISKINEKAATRSLQITWVILFAISVANLSAVLSMDNDFFRAKMLHMAMPLLINLAVMLLIYAIFRVYYTKMYAGYEGDEESD